MFMCLSKTVTNATGIQTYYRAIWTSQHSVAVLKIASSRQRHCTSISGLLRFKGIMFLQLCMSRKVYWEHLICICGITPFEFWPCPSTMHSMCLLTSHNSNSHIMYVHETDITLPAAFTCCIQWRGLCKLVCMFIASCNLIDECGWITYKKSLSIVHPYLILVHGDSYIRYAHN